MNRREANAPKEGSLCGVDARNSFYRERLSPSSERSRALRRAPAVTVIDLRGFGVWGEWHSVFNMAAWRSAEPRWRHSGCLVVSVSRQQLALSYFLRPDGPKDLYSGPTDRFEPIAPQTITNTWLIRFDQCADKNQHYLSARWLRRRVHSMSAVSMTKHSANTGARR